MVLTAERAKMLSDYLVSDTERGQRLVELPVDEALALINADGYDFTIEELTDFREVAIKAAEMQAENGELSEEALSEVSGGVVVTAAVVGAIAIGVVVASKIRW